MNGRGVIMAPGEWYLHRSCRFSRRYNLVRHISAATLEGRTKLTHGVRIGKIGVLNVDKVE